MSVATSNIANQPIVTSVSFERIEFPTNGGCKVGQETVKKLVVTPSYGVKNSNPIIEEAIDGFQFLYSEPKSKDSKIKFGESRTITFDVEEEVDQLVSKDKSAEVWAKREDPIKAILKPGPVFVHDSELLETDDISSLDEYDEKVLENASNQDVITLLQRIFTLHDIPTCEIKQDLLETLQILALGVVKSFKQREQCYKYVGRKECTEELDEIEYMNDNLKCELANLNKKLNNERVKWEVVDEIFAENDSLKVKVEELMSTKQQLSEELQHAPKWEDVDGLLEEDKQLNSKIDQLTSLNVDLKKKYAQIEITTSKLTGEYERDREELISSKKSVQVELEETSTKLNESTQQMAELRKEKDMLNTELCICTKNVENATIKLEEMEEHVQDLSKIVEDYRKKNFESFQSHPRLIEKLDRSAVKLRNVELANVELVSASANLTSKLHGMKRTVDCLTSENIGMKKKMKLMKKKAYNRFFDENVSLSSRNEEFAKKLEQALKKLEEFGNLQKDYEALSSKNNGLAANRDDLILMNKNLTQRLEAESWRAKQLEGDFTAAQDKIVLLDINLRREGQWHETLSQETGAEVCQLKNLRQKDISRVVRLCHELGSAERGLVKSLRTIGQTRHDNENDKQLVQDSGRRRSEGQPSSQDFNSLQNERATLLRKCSELEFELSKLQTENVELRGYKKDYSLFDEKYEWLESIALSLRQVKKCSDDQIKDLQRKLKDAKNTIDLMEKAKLNCERRPQELQIQLHQLKLHNFELCQRFSKKDRELQESFHKMREMAVMLRSTMSLAKTLDPSDEVTLVEPNNSAESTLKTFLPLKWWKTST